MVRQAHQPAVQLELVAPSEGPRRMIYVPAGWEPGCERGFPVIVWVDWLCLGEWRGNRDLEALQAGRYSWWRASRMIEYSERRWTLCQEHMEKRRALDEEYRGIAKRLVRA